MFKVDVIIFFGSKIKFVNVVGVRLVSVVVWGILVFEGCVMCLQEVFGGEFQYDFKVYDEYCKMKWVGWLNNENYF